MLSPDERNEFAKTALIAEVAEIEEPEIAEPEVFEAALSPEEDIKLIAEDKVEIVMAAIAPENVVDEL